MPRPRKSERSLKTSGTFRSDRRGSRTAGEQLTAVPPPPAGASERVRLAWSEVAPLIQSAGTLTAADLPALRLLAESLATAALAQETIDREGITVQSGNGSVKPHPALNAMDKARSQAHRLLNDFGLTPKARNYVSPAPTDNRNNPFKEFE